MISTPKRASYPSGPTIFSSGSSTTPAKTDNSSDKKNYRFIRTHERNGIVVLWINYPQFKNYEGNKILVYKDTTLVDILNQDYIDPHFLEERGRINPFARFRPTEEGWTIAVRLADYI